MEREREMCDKIVDVCVLGTEDFQKSNEDASSGLIYWL